MATKPAGTLNVLTGLGTGTSDNVLLQPDKAVSINLSLTSGSPATGARLEVTNSTPESIADSSAIWTSYVAPGASSANYLTNQMLVSAAGDGCSLTGVRAVVTDGTWALTVRQPS